MALLCTGPGILCALASVFASSVYVRNRHLLERIMQDKVSIIHFDFATSRSSFVGQGATNLPFNLWTFLALPSLYFAWSLLLLGLVLFICLFTPDHQPFLWDLAIMNIPVPVLSTGISLLVILVPCSLVARNFQVLFRAIVLGTTLQPPSITLQTPVSLKPVDLSSPSVVESTGLVTLETALGWVPTAAYAILGYAFLC
jgi:hypothetical protein